MGLYLGQVMFRYSGAGRLDSDSYSKNASVILKLIFGLILVFIFEIPYVIKNLIISDISLWAKAIFVLAIPYLIVGYVISYSLPKLTSRACNYPQTLPEVTKSDFNLIDAEKGAEVKSLQIKGKYTDLRFFKILTLTIFTFRNLIIIKPKKSLNQLNAAGKDKNHFVNGIKIEC